MEIDDEVADDEYPYSIFADWVAMAPVSELAKVIFMLLRAHGNKSNGGNTSYPHQKKIGQILGYAKIDPIISAISELEQIGAVTRSIVPCRGGRRTIYKTHLTPHLAANYDGPRKIADLRDPGVLEDLAAARRPRRRAGRGTRTTGNT